MDAFLISAGLVALAEMGDKTQLLALFLTLRYQKPWPILAGILVATVLNHALAGALGAWLTTWLDPIWLRRILGVSFLLMAVWVLIPDHFEEKAPSKLSRSGVFFVTASMFFLAEMGDKTQIATVMLAAQHSAWFAVVLGTTLGMLLANAPVVWLGERVTRRIPVVWMHRLCAVLFAVLGLTVLLGEF